MKKRIRSLVIGFYFHPEVYPPTLNAIHELAECFDRIIVVHRNHQLTSWEYPSNVVLVPCGNFVSELEQQQAGFLKKIGFFFNFTWIFLRKILKARPAVILVYDHISLLAYHVVRRVLPRAHKIWYHNHDVYEEGAVRKYSISWFALKAEHKSFHYLDIFSLPAIERRQYFPMSSFKGRFFFIPNYPSRSFYNKFYTPAIPDEKIRIVYQGRVTYKRGIEEIVPLLAKTINGKSLELGLLGPCLPDYESKIRKLANDHKASANVVFESYSYSRLPAITAQYDIGLGILADETKMHATVGTASNKLYEYAALGLPVIYLDNPHFRSLLKDYNWAMPAALTSSSIAQAIGKILDNYAELSRQAHRDFETKLNFEAGFAEAKRFVGEKPI